MGIVRNIDDMGRITLPKELRRKAGMIEGSSVEIDIMEDGTITLNRVETKELFECKIDEDGKFYTYSTRKELINKYGYSCCNFTETDIEDFLNGKDNFIQEICGEAFYIQSITVDRVIADRDNLNNIINEYKQDN